MPGAAALTPLDRERLRQALALAESAIGRTDPNPRVGCVVGHDDGRVFGRGATQPPGSAHAEVMALRDAAAAGHAVRGATAWVTLEPCAHHGRTPPCCDALLAAGVARVVAAVEDPFPAVAGRGLARLRAAGVETVLAAASVEADDRSLAQAAWALNIGFFCRVRHGRPWLRSKVAASLDGRTALPDGRSQWITGAAARADGHRWRQRAGALLTGIGTVLADDPQLTVRVSGAPPPASPPLRVVLDPSLRLPPQARLLHGEGPVLCVHAVAADAAAHAAAADALRARGVELLACPGVDGRVDLAAVVDALAARGVNEVHVEAGATLNGALLRAGAVDEWLVYLAPLLLGDGRGMVALPALPNLDAAPRLHAIDAQAVGEDWRWRLLSPRGRAMWQDWLDVEQLDSRVAARSRGFDATC